MRFDNTSLKISEMSDELGVASDLLLQSLEEFDMDVVIPPLSDSNVIENDIEMVEDLETQYNKLNIEFINKLNKLIYLASLKKFSRYANEDIDELYNEYINKYFDPLILKHTSKDEYSLSEIRQVLESQLQSIKSSKLLNYYFQCSIPILRSIHGVRRGSTISESLVSKNLKGMYDYSNRDSDANIYNLMKSIRRNHLILEQNAISKIEVLNQTGDSISSTICSLEEVEKNISELQKKLAEIKLTRNQNMTSYDQSSLRQKYLDMVSIWSQIMTLCNLFPFLISSLPINWYEHTELFEMAQATQVFQIKTQKLLSLVNSRNLQSYSIEELLCIDLDEMNEYDT